MTDPTAYTKPNLKGKTMTTTETEMSRAELWPEGRHFYYEGDDPAGFVRELKARFGIEAEVTFDCPPELLDAIHAAKYALGT